MKFSLFHMYQSYLPFSERYKQFNVVFIKWVTSKEDKAEKVKRLSERNKLTAQYETSVTGSIQFA